jgi:putative DNA primase/helicase
MKLASRTFDPPFKVPIGDGYELVVVAGGPAPHSGVRADLEVWNGDIQHADRGIVVSAARARAEFAAAVTIVTPKVDRAALDKALLKLSVQLRSKLQERPRTTTPDSVDDANEALEPPSEPYSELWNAEQLVLLHGDRLRYCGESGWFIYRGGVWREDRTGHVARLTKRMVRQWLRDAANAKTSETSTSLATWAVKCHTASKLDSTLRLAQTESKVAIAITDFDKDPVLLNVANGTVNLRTEEMHPHDSEDLLSKQCPVDYDPDAKAPRWERFLREVFSDDEALIGYVQRLLGYSLTGLQIYHLLVFLWGAGRNGKTTLLETVAKVAGEYARSISSELLLVSRENSDYNAAQLRGVRLAITSETGLHRKVDEARVKQLTGGDTVPARHPYGRPFTFTPTHHVWTMSNHKPTIEGMDHGIWSRVKLIEFQNRFERPPADVDPKDWQPGPHIRLADPTLATELEREAPGILAWLVRGAAAALRGGLQEPASVIEATGRYRDQMDVLGGFLEDCCDLGPYLSDTSKHLYAAYRGWCVENGVEPVASNKFGMLLAGRDTFVAIKPTSGGDENRQRRWSGLQVKPSDRDYRNYDDR